MRTLIIESRTHDGHKERRIDYVADWIRDDRFDLLFADAAYSALAGLARSGSTLDVPNYAAYNAFEDGARQFHARTRGGTDVYVFAVECEPPGDGGGVLGAIPDGITPRSLPEPGSMGVLDCEYPSHGFVQWLESWIRETPALLLAVSRRPPVGQGSIRLVPIAGSEPEDIAGAAYGILLEEIGNGVPDWIARRDAADVSFKAMLPRGVELSIVPEKPIPGRAYGTVSKARKRSVPAVGYGAAGYEYGRDGGCAEWLGIWMPEITPEEAESVEA